jgi:methylenetetrahydrofolate dehydrogenase (NADP+)/methenyltetrahydrofolate cyclohydrolase
MAHLLTMADGTVTVCHSRTPNMSEITQQADIVVVAAGQKHLLGREDFKEGAVVIDVGIHGSGQGKGVTGDVRFQELEGWVSAATPVPGGVGPMTIACLLENTMTLAQLRVESRG